KATSDSRPADPFALPWTPPATHAEPSRRSLTMPTTTDPAALRPEQIEAYHRDGYVVLPELFSRGDLDRVEAGMAELIDRSLAAGDYGHILELEPGSAEAGEPAVRRLFDPFLQHEAFRAIAADPRLIAALADLIGPDLDIQNSKLNMKPAH